MGLGYRVEGFGFRVPGRDGHTNLLGGSWGILGLSNST